MFFIGNADVFAFLKLELNWSSFFWPILMLFSFHCW